KFLADEQDLELREPVDFQFENRIRLFRVEAEPLDDLLRRVRLPFGLADDLEDVVERVKDLFEALENVDAFFDRRQLVFQSLGDDIEPEMKEVPEHRMEIEALRPADFGVLG